MGGSMYGYISQATTAGRYYNIELSYDYQNSINRGDQILIAARRTANSNQTTYFLRAVFTILFEES